MILFEIYSIFFGDLGKSNMQKRPFENHLCRLGLSDKESKVYLASLELGAAAVQKIAQKAGVKRATTYVAIESLVDRGLMSSVVKGKKTYYTSESPKRLLGIIDAERNAVEKKQDIIKDLLPDLLAIVSSSAEKPKLSFYEGLEGLRIIQEDVLVSVGNKLENVVSLDDAEKVVTDSQDILSFRETLHRRGVDVRILYSSKKKPLSIPREFQKRWKIKKIDQDKYPIHGEITLYGDKVAAFSYRGKIVGTIIESKEIAQTIRVLFEIAWHSETKKAR